ncbi:protein serine/threonine phosphatase 2C [Phellopilus nigrolimitatus]|nr:protein serine/threonine phosphatase 2C [Phellopilus nigrolimitatus]
MSTLEYTIKLAAADDLGSSYDNGIVQWPRPYRSYTSHSAFNAELARIADAAMVTSRDGKLIAHNASFQPFSKPEANASEDRQVVQFWELQSGIWTFAIVLDGHAGPEMADYAQKKLPSLIRKALEAALLGGNLPPGTISDILKQVIETFDKSLKDELLAVLPGDFEKLDDKELKNIVNDQESGGRVYERVLRCMRGSTALVTLIDPGKENIWVVNLGDCQATLAEADVDKPEDFKAILLSSPHNGHVESEVRRVQSEHPNEPEAILRYRVLGALAVTRALGDFAFKLPPIYTYKIFLNASPGFRVRERVEEYMPRSLTPPYVSATPEVVHRALRPKAGRESRKRKYALVLCSDGLTDLYDARGWTQEGAARQIARVCMKGRIHDAAEWDGFGGNMALCISKDALGDDLETQSLKLTVDLDFQHLDDTTVIVLLW